MIELLREASPKVLAALVRRYGNFADAEDALQEALLAAAQQWPDQGVPDNPHGWIYTAACRRMVDFIRSEVARRERQGRWSMYRETAETGQNDTVALLCMCCHASLPRHAAVALTLRAVAGLTTAEIASAFLVPEPTMAQRISRAKNRIRDSGIGFELPTRRDQPERVRSVRDVLYLMFNEGYNRVGAEGGTDSELTRTAIRLTRTLRERFPEDRESAGLLAFMLLTEARRPARIGRSGESVPLDRQDRNLWNTEQIREGTELISEVLPGGPVGSYQIQAAIAAVHDEASCAQDTDWSQILALYGLLERISENPLVTLNRAVAMAMVRGPEAGLQLLKPLESDRRVAESHRLNAVRAHLNLMAGEHHAALEHFHAAAAKTPSRSELAYLRGQIAELASRVD